MADGAHPPHRFGSLFEGTPTYDSAVRRKGEAFGFLDRVCQILEPSQTQQDRAKTSYEAVGDWLGSDPQLVEALIYAQGSAALGTMVKPIGDYEFDVDLICRVPGYTPALPPARLKALIGDRLKAHGVYEGLLEELPRCWRLNYAGEFHLDITPSILNPACNRGGELVPDRKLQAYKASNPIGYRDLFARRARLTPFVQVSKAMDARARAEVEAFPVSARVKGVLRRTVQLLKRHRDHSFLKKNPALAPLSVIITTLASRAYEFCVGNYPYDNELDLVCDVIRAMPWFIESSIVEGRRTWTIPNESTEGENFAEKWNAEPQRAASFFAWHAEALAAFEAFAAAAGLDEIQRCLSDAIGEEPVRKAVGAITEEIGAARKAGSLLVKPSVGLIAGAAAGTPVRANTFFGR
jgi:hypothetical protein